MHTFRTPESAKLYKAYQEEHRDNTTCSLCTEPAKSEFVHWRILKNNFPYDALASTHDLIVPRRHVVESELTAEEIEEYISLKKDILFLTYEYLLEAARKSLPKHYHVHLIVTK